MDREVERRLTRALLATFPGCAVIGEEGAEGGAEDGPTFYIDPIDGTRSYLQGLPTWCLTVCLTVRGEPVLGAIYSPAIDEYWFAARGYGAFREDRPLTIPPAPSIRIATLFVSSRFHTSGVHWPGRIRALGSAALHLAHVAAGAGAIAWIPQWKLWDVGAGVLLVQEAGGVLSDLRGQTVDVNLSTEGLPFAAGAPNALSEWFVET